MKAFVTVGVERKPFGRLLRAVDRLVADGVLSGETLVQTGHNDFEPCYGLYQKFLSFDDMVNAVRSADMVIAHAGVGSVLLCRQLGKVPLVVPRSGDLGEHVDNHQLEFARMMDAQGFVIMAPTPDDMRQILAQTPRERWRANGENARTAGLVTHVRTILNELGST